MLKLRHKTMHRESGLTLVELMIAMSISVLVIVAFVASFTLIVKGGRSSVEVGRLNSQLNHVISLMTTDIQRAGYWGQATTSSTNPFMVTGTTDIQVNVGNNCILLTYDRDGNGSLPAIAAGSDDERYGFRLNNNTIQYRPPGATFSCSAAATNWTDLTDPKVVTITAFSATLNAENVDIDGEESGTETMVVRRVDISITGQLVSDTAIVKTIDKQVKVYNDKYNP